MPLRIQCNFISLVEDSKSYVAFFYFSLADEGFATIQQDQDRLESCAGRDLMWFNKSKCRVLPLGRNKHIHRLLYGLGDDLLERNSVVKDWESWWRTG